MNTFSINYTHNSKLMATPRVRVTDQLFVKFPFKQINWSHEYDSNKHGQSGNFKRTGKAFASRLLSAERMRTS